MRAWLGGAALSLTLAQICGCGTAETQPSETGRDTRPDERTSFGQSRPTTGGFGLVEPRPLQELVDHEGSRAELVQALRDDFQARPEYHPWGYSAATDWSTKVEALLADGWSVRSIEPVVPEPPVDWGVARHDDSNWHFLLNSFRPFAPLLFDALQADDRDSLLLMLELAEDWLDYNLIQGRPNEKKWHDMGTGIRAHHFSTLLAELLRRGPSAMPAGSEQPERYREAVEQLVRALHHHAQVLADPDLYPGGNHALYMMLGLAPICHVVPSMRGCGAWPEYAVNGVERYLEHAVSSDHVGLEHSPEYHRLVASVLDRMRDTQLFGDRFDAQIDAMFEQLLWMYHPNGEIVMIGDSAGQAKRGESATLDFALTNGESGTRPPEAPVAFEDAGYAMLRSSWYQMPYNEHSFLFLSAAHHSGAHKQADDLTFEWSRRGTPVIVDSGKYTYNSGEDRDFFVSTRSANTLEVDGQDLAFGKSVAYGSGLIGVGSTDCGTQFASAHAPRPRSDTRHTRVLVMHDDWLLVADRMSANDEHVYRQWFGFHESFELDTGGASPRLRSGELEVVMVDALNNGKFESFRGELSGRQQGWISREYQEREPRWSLSNTVAGSDVTLAAVLAFDGVEVLEARQTAAGIEITVAATSGTSEYLVDLRGDAADEPAVVEKRIKGEACAAD